MTPKIITLEKGWYLNYQREPESARGKVVAVVDPDSIPELKEAPPFMKIGAIMKLLDCSDDFLYEAIEKGRLKAQRLGKKDYRVSRTNLAAFLAAENLLGK